MKITVLGMYGGYPYAGKGTSSYLLQGNNFNLLLDCGSGALLSLEQHLDPLKLNAVLLSHYHYDHIADVGVLQYYWQLNNKSGNLLPIYGHKEDEQHFNELSWPQATEGHAYDPQKLLEVGPYRISFLRTKHPVAAFAMRITEIATNKVFVFTADTAYFEKLAEFAQGADLLLTDTNFSAEKKGTKWHMTSRESGILAKQAGTKRLVISHLPQNVEFSKLQKETAAAAGNKVTVEVADVGKKFEVD
ncbi:MBL fold metallo-hydrolase [Liquorilactobacillus oeni]|uniref:Beta-lactamase domain-containing protein n=1 Tax=Liquorilactobacillus oeni DSM 19972 TaxID=1423777 RepID=A0A0R1M9I1_9LACO|nr:MBL fold metallo-hydrolase [Liquorilactobacillus oeni]KRL04799.1 beta-lactamase domain-containing protein [Liquorilactobacillus oeni DSM 19972]